jgi:GNAT superfamily N-acetyltransferase
VEVRTLRARLGLDSGYVSRVLRALERHKLVKVRAGGRDRRVRYASLTKAGLAERAELDRRSDALASRILQPLNDRQRTRLLDAMRDVERLIEASMIQFGVEDPGSPDAQWCLAQYFAELNERFEGGFDPRQSQPIVARELIPPAGAFVIARLRGRPVACGLVKCPHGEAAYIRRMWVAPEARGLGTGRRLLQELEHHARACGAKVARLDTNRALAEAITMYRKSGYVEVEPFSDEHYAHHWFEKRLSGRARAAPRPAPS